MWLIDALTGVPCMKNRTGFDNPDAMLVGLWRRHLRQQKQDTLNMRNRRNRFMPAAYDLFPKDQNKSR